MRRENEEMEDIYDNKATDNVVKTRRKRTLTASRIVRKQEQHSD